MLLRGSLRPCTRLGSTTRNFHHEVYSLLMELALFEALLCAYDCLALASPLYALQRIFTSGGRLCDDDSAILEAHKENPDGGHKMFMLGA